ncbi:MAG: cysteine synthase A [Deltaproteobacteria bacterium]|nr:cysteine synthase A [Deltaproteobacteria bacterium]
MNTTKGFAGTVGNTPLMRLKSLSDATGCEILAKAEFLNPGGSVKDRAALGIISDAEAKGLLGLGGTVVEGTAGNTGIGLAHVAQARGYKTIIVIPETQSLEKMQYLRALGAEVRAVPAKPYRDPDNYNHVAKRLAASIPGGYWANQFDNTANRDQHIKSTGPEIWQNTDGRVDGFVSVVGTGGTLAGVATYLKSRNSKIRTVCADPHGAAIWSWIKHGNLDFNAGSSVTEGIGQNRVTANLADAPIDDAYRIADQPIVEMVYAMLRLEGLFIGASAALNLCGAYRLAKELGPGHVIVTILCDSGNRYVSRLFNPDWLREKNLTPTSRDLSFLATVFNDM